MAQHTTGKIQIVFKILEKSKQLGLHVRNDGIFGFKGLSIFSMNLGDDGDGPFLCKKFICVIGSIRLNGHSLRDIDVDG